MKSSSNTRISAEVTIMKIAQPMFDESKEALLKRIETYKENRSGNIKVVSANDMPRGNVEGEQATKEIEPEPENEEVTYENVKSEDVRLIESSWKKIIQKIKDDRRPNIYALLKEVESFNVNNNILYIIFNDNFSFARSRLSSKDTIEYVEKKIREVLNRSFNLQILFKSEVQNVNMQIEENKSDKGEEILKSLVNQNILEVKDSIEK